MSERKSFTVMAYGAKDLTKELPPLIWVCEGLRISEGSYTLAFGVSYSGKSLFAQNLAIAIATGTNAIETFQTTQMSVLHVDFEQGERITIDRYQRIINTLNNYNESECRIHFVCSGTESPGYDRIDGLRLTDPNSEHNWECTINNYSPNVIIVDSMVQLVAGVDENSTKILSYISTLRSLCRRKKIALIIIHHSNKPSNNDSRSALHRSRGSSAIVGDADNIIFFDCDGPGKPTRVINIKDRMTGNEFDEFYFRPVDGEMNGKKSLTLKHITQDSVSKTETAQEVRSSSMILGRIESLLKSMPNWTWDGKEKDFVDKITGKRKHILDAMRVLKASGRVVVLQSNCTIRWVEVEAPDSN